MRTFILLTLALAILTAQAAEVYRYVDEKGNTVFTDQPRSGAQRMVVEPAPATSVVVPILPAPSQAPAKASTKPGSEAFAGYTDLRITQPGPSEILVNTAGDVDVSLNLHPPLRADLGHGLTVLLDGAPVAQNTTRMNLVLNNIDRGEHVLEAFVLDAAGQVLIQSIPVHFTLQRPSLLQPGRQAPGAPLSPIPPPVPQLRPAP
jgi:hypothetical protein